MAGFAGLNEIVKTELLAYVGGGINVQVFPLFNEEAGVYAINMLEGPPQKRPARVVILVRMIGDTVVIAEDITDRPFVDALTRAGIPREQIILTYAGETLPPEVIEVKTGSTP